MEKKFNMRTATLAEKERTRKRLQKELETIGLAGRSWKQICEAYSVKPETVRNWVKDYGWTVHPSPGYKGGPRTVSPRKEAERRAERARLVEEAKRQNGLSASSDKAMKRTEKAGEPEGVGKPKGKRAAAPGKIGKGLTFNELGKESAKCGQIQKCMQSDCGESDAALTKSQESPDEPGECFALSKAGQDEHDRIVADLVRESLLHAPKRIVITKPGDLKILDDLHRRATGRTRPDAGEGGGAPRFVVNVGFLASLDRHEPVTMDETPILQDVDPE